MQVPQTPFYKRSAFIYLAIACAALVFTGIAALFHNNHPRVKFTNFPVQMITYDLPPGGNKAMLTLANGNTVTLNEVADGELSREGGLIIVKTGHGELVYRKTDDLPKPGENTQVNRIVTPKGGTYHVSLPDGTKVWLNADSKLEFSLDLQSQRERKVFLSGEAYFEVAEDAGRPFKVVTDKQELEAGASKFNLNSYGDNDQLKTTVVEGSLKVTALKDQLSKTETVEKKSVEHSAHGILVKSGQQAVLTAGVITVEPAKVSNAVAWQKGLFVFDNEPLESIMKMISRWYDADVVYKDADKFKTFSGSVAFTENVSTLLNMLEASGGVHFKIEEGRIMVTRL